jgi:cobaltochelatase CobN
MRRHGYKGAFELAATVDYLFGYDATARVVEDWMYERVTAAYVGDPEVRAFFEQSNPWALRSIAEKLLEADRRGLWEASDAARKTLVDAVLEAEGWEESAVEPTPPRHRPGPSQNPSPRQRIGP